ncbi:MAG: ABC transporter permease subunit [Deltaproteobacteria bacterium]|nr:MAG: ABC transporter permease subunit [Deltaproteobacteria bacterium]
MSALEPRDRRRVALATAATASVVAAGWFAGADPTRLADAHGAANFAALLRSLLSPDLSGPFLSRIGGLAVDSILIGALGLAMALAVAAPLAIAAARVPGLADDPLARRWRTAGRRALRSSARGVLAFFRAVPEILWAYLFVRIFGLGPGPAVFALALSFGGIIGKLFAELIEAADPTPIRRLQAAGAGRIAVLTYGVLPQVRSQWIAYALFRLECSIRSASILGVVGAGGLGSEIDLSIRYFQYDKLATALLAVLAYVVALEIASARLRRARPGWPLALFCAGAIAGVARLDIPWRAVCGEDATAQLRAFFAGFVSPTTDAAFLVRAVRLAAVTVAMAWAATALAAAAAFVLAPLSATTFTVRGYLDDAPAARGPRRYAALAVIAPARAALQVARALPELVWALLFIVWVGPGPTAGILALAVHTTGILGRLYGDALEEAEPGPARLIERSGAGPLSRYLYGVLPQALPRIASFSLFRFEVNIRDAAMVGFVGAGGLGDALHTAISLFHMSDLATLVAVTIAVVVAVDGLGDRVRHRLPGVA